MTPFPSPAQHPLISVIRRLESGQALLLDTPRNLIEVVGILKSYGVVLDAYSINLCFIAEQQFLVLFPFFKYFNGQITPARLLRHWNHDRINYEYAEYCMRTMMWHGGGGLDAYLDSDAFRQQVEVAIQARIKGNPLLQLLHRTFPEFLPEQVRQSAFTSALGQFWRVMADMFLSLEERYLAGEIGSIPDVVTHIREGLVAAAGNPITQQVEIGGKVHDILPASEGLTFLPDVAIPYVEAVFFRGTPFPGTVSYNAQANQIPVNQGEFMYGALYADPLPIGGSGIPPTLLMQDMRHYIPDYLHAVYQEGLRGEQDLRVQICESFQKSMFCVTTAAIQALAPYYLFTIEPEQRAANEAYLAGWMDRFVPSRLQVINAESANL
jgi:CO2 hydration protein